MDFGIIAIIISTAFFFLLIFSSLRGLKDSKGDLTKIKHWLNLRTGKGDLADGTLLSWHQTETTYGEDYLFLMTLLSNVEGEEKEYQAVGLVRASKIHLLKKTLPLTIKYQGTPPKKMSVINVQYD
ncbi:hypothetical protein N5923_08940 [Erwiniaceae bacterium BAC15a-03b]|uniref:DUF3592 domain-containing protein n=1 Tax=Winslowiella arboricola TaxID=2978220 RepID=A0A9J6PPS5_9GAMM|nr:hypothetical protein [Winslowiella arboricola]MCU5771713.1 hypothetical protein [Winslowiella arboricola]MCU5777616.1 hypothetical protein [Winslowiella arboricola]